MEAFRVLSQHPHIIPTLFRGELVEWPNIPWDYIPTWALITAPPVALALAALGIAGVARLCAVRWRGALANSTARFGLLILACLILPIAAAIALNSNLYNGWRQMYFLWAPLCVLAAFGLNSLASIPAPRLRIGALALTVVGIALAVAQIISLHPFQNHYFNPLANKSGIADRWQMNYWSESSKLALDRMLSLQPAGRVSVNSDDLGAHLYSGSALVQNLAVIPREDRLRTSINGFSPDFYIDESGDFKNPAWTLEVYGAAIVSLVDNREAARREYADAYAAAKSRELDFSAHFDVHVIDDMVVYLKEPCAEDDVSGTFAISARPVHPDATAGYMRDDGFGDKRFQFWTYGKIVEDACLMAVRLPTYPLESLRASRRLPNDDRELWSADIPVNHHMEAYESAMDSEPLARSPGFDVYEDGGTLTYVKSPCAESDARGRFGLSAYPADQSDLPKRARDAGLEHESLNFDFHRYGAIFGGDCVIVRKLPDYPLSHLETGQWIPREGGGLWSARIIFDGYYDRFRRALSALSGDVPAILSNFDVYTDGNTLTYVKSPCAESDTRGRFALSIYPIDQTDLPQNARDAVMDHESLNFDFPEHGAIIDGDCVIIRNLPGYPITRIETGQWIPGEGGLWDAEIAVSD